MLIECSQEDIKHLQHQTIDYRPPSGKLVADLCLPQLWESTSAIMENNDNTNRNTVQSGTPVVRKCSYKEVMSCQTFNFKGMEGAVSLIRWFERTE
ncbi:hypothetical protein Tco_0832197 [Tanacetum coccineum]